MRVKAVAVIAATGALLTASAAAGTAPAGGTIGIYATPTMGTVARIVVTGAIGDYGIATQINKDGKFDPNGGYVKVVLKHGGFEVNSIALNKKANAARPTTNSTTTCSFSVSTSGAVTLFNGTGMYAGLKGIAHVTMTFAGLGARYATGPKKGQCNKSNTSQPIAFWSAIDGLGEVTF
jgi:hypothetical protein